MIMLSGVMLVNSQDMSKERFEVIIGTQVVVQGRIPVVAKKVTTSVKKATPTKKKTTKKKVVKKKTIKKKAKKKVVKKKAIKKTKYNYRYNVGEIQSYAHQLVISYGWTEADYQALVLLWYRESSWNPYAYNKSSGACGIAQAKPCSKMAKFGRDYRTNWKVQVNWGLDYIKEVYTTPSEAYRKFLGRKPHWY